MAEENTEIGAKRAYALSDPEAKPLKKDLKAGLVTDPNAEETKLSTQTPDPNVESLGDTTPSDGTSAPTTTTTITTRSNS